MDTEKQRQRRRNDARLTENGNARSEQLLVMPTESLTNREWLPGELLSSPECWRPGWFLDTMYQTCLLAVYPVSWCYICGGSDITQEPLLILVRTSNPQVLKETCGLHRPGVCHYSLAVLHVTYDHPLLNFVWTKLHLLDIQGWISS